MGKREGERNERIEVNKSGNSRRGKEEWSEFPTVDKIHIKNVNKLGCWG